MKFKEESDEEENTMFYITCLCGENFKSMSTFREHKATCVKSKKVEIKNNYCIERYFNVV